MCFVSFALCALNTARCVVYLSLHSTFMCAVQGSEGDNKEGSGVFPSVNQVREGPLGVTVTSQTLDESEPSRKTLDHGADTIGVGITHIFTCGE